MASYTEELYKKDLNDPDNNNGVITHLEPDILECKVKWALESNPVYETAKETLMYRTVLWTLWEREKVGRFGRMTLKHVKYHV